MNADGMPEMNILAGLAGVLGTECPQCGEINTGDAENCEFCGAPLPLEHEEEMSLSFVQNDLIGDEEDELSHLENFMMRMSEREAKALKFIDKAVEGARNGSITYEEYCDSIKKALRSAEEGSDLLQAPHIRKILESYSADYQRQVDKALVNYQKYVAGCNRMLQYDGGEDGTHAMHGYLAIEKALKNMKKIEEEVKKLAG